MKRIIGIILAVLLSISFANAMINYIYFDAKFVKADPSQLGDKKIYYSNDLMIYYEDRKDRMPDDWKDKTYLDYKKEYETNYNLNNPKTYNFATKGDFGFVYKYKKRENLQTYRTKYLREKQKQYNYRQNGFRSSIDYSNGFLR